MTRKLPTDWSGCPKMGEGLIQGLFLTFKTPLSPALNSKVGTALQFHVDDVFSEVDRLQKAKILWIDLTNTNRYYSRAEVENRKGVSYVKMPMRGHGIPSEADRNGFNQAVDKFIEENPQGLIAVHCTHGFNRTGYLISSYLITRKGISAPEAVAEFSAKRSGGIYRRNYIENLYQLGRCSVTTLIPDVKTPAWVTGGK